MLPRRRVPFVALCAVAALLAGAVSAGAQTTTTTPASTTAAAPAQKLTWRKCGKLECSTLKVPVDYSQPDGEQVSIAVSRKRAADPSKRLGSLIVNFGGPGDAGATTLADFAGTYPKEIRDRYDVVSFDPRGVGKSRPVVCVDDTTTDALNDEDPTPDSDAELRSFYDGTSDVADFVAGCVAKNGDWLGRLGSRNVARDIDRLRASLGDDKLNYLGYSYGTVIGAVYAQMFPQTVGRMVLDAPVDLSVDALAELQADAKGFEHALESFLTDCADDKKCTFHSAGDPQSAFRELQQSFEGGAELDAETLSGDPTDRKVGVATFYTAVLSALYDKAYGWPTLARALEDAKAGDGTLLLALADSYNGRNDDGTYSNIEQVFDAIHCDDRYDATQSWEDFVAEYQRQVKAYPLLGAYTGSTKLGCDPRYPQPPASEQLGDVRVNGAPPILILGTTHDPATAYQGAIDLQSRIAGSRLVSFDSTEHTAYTKSACIDDIVDAYLIKGTVPKAGITCKA
ncbi:MAG: alpha/beta hydrolase [Acidimicrobiia bacterium]